MKARSPVIDWDRLKQQGVHPSFCLPSSYHAVRAHVPLASIREMCDKHPHDEFHNMCYREAVVIPLLLNQPEGTNLDNQVYRAHVERSRRCLGHTAPSEEKRRDAWEVKAGRPLPSLDLGHTWQDLVKVLNAETPRLRRKRKRTLTCCAVCLWTTLQQLRGCWKLLGEQGDRLFNTLNMDHANTSTIVEENSPPAGAGRRKHKHHGLVGAGTASPKVKDFAYRMESQAPSSLA
ncbi:unnamed protein product [Effrenium voratum]|nr:unnamed protein product [Effrenium voratum]